MSHKKTGPRPIELQKCLHGVDYPANKEDLRSAAEGNGASQEILGLIDELERDEYDSPAAVSKAFGESEE